MKTNKNLSEITVKIENNGNRYRATRSADGAVSIDRLDNGSWIWAGNGRWSNGTIADCPADLGDDVYASLDDHLGGRE